MLTAEGVAMSGNKRFVTLDGMRGIAAIMVMLGHVKNLAPVDGQLNSPPIHAPGGYLAVDLFFALSGFVLVQAYEQRLRAGLATTGFMVMRLIRLYPMYFLAALLSGGSLAQLSMIPIISPTSSMYVPNVPMWSLLAELIVSLIFVLVIARTGWSGLCAILVPCAIIVACRTVAVTGSMEFGSKAHDLPWELARTLFAFTVGVAIARLYRRSGMKQHQGRWGWALLVFFPLPFLYDPVNRVWWDLVCVFALFPALIWLGIRFDLADARLPRILGDLSYPLYCIHFPVLIWAAGTGTHMTAVVTLLTIVAWCLDRWFDRPARAFLIGLSRAKKPRPVAIQP
jgi:peptidoglycan/LPS O-acetylase OafA/YrhL